MLSNLRSTGAIDEREAGRRERREMDFKRNRPSECKMRGERTNMAVPVSHKGSYLGNLCQVACRQ